MRSEGFLFLSGGSGGGTVFVSILEMIRSRTTARPMRCALRIGLQGGRLGGALYRCVVGIGGESVVWVALCRGDWRGERGLGGAVPWGLVGRAWSGWRSAVAIGGESVVWAALCHGVRWGERGLGGAVPW